MDRISQIKTERDIRFKDFFSALSDFLEKVNDFRLKKEKGDFYNQSFEELAAFQDKLY